MPTAPAPRPPTAPPPRPPTPTFRAELLRPSPTLPLPPATATPPPAPTRPRPTAAPRATAKPSEPLAAIPPGYVPRATALTYRIPLEDIGELGALDRSIAVTELVHAMRQNPHLELFLGTYVEESDVKAKHADARSLADRLFFEVTRYFASRGVDPLRIRGKGMGVDPRVGRGIVAYLEFPPPSARLRPTEAPESAPTPDAEEPNEALARAESYSAIR